MGRAASAETESMFAIVRCMASVLMRFRRVFIIRALGLMRMTFGIILIDHINDFEGAEK